MRAGASWYEKALGKEHPSAIDAANSIALVYSSQGRYEEALVWYERALAGYEKAFWEDREHSQQHSHMPGGVGARWPKERRPRGVARINAVHGEKSEAPSRGY